MYFCYFIYRKGGRLRTTFGTSGHVQFRSSGEDAERLLNSGKATSNSVPTVLAS